MHLKKLSSQLFIAILLSSSTVNAADNSSLGITNFAFASYLGTGFYSTSGQDVFVIQAPFNYTITKKTNTEAGLVINLPITFGIVNLDNLDSENLPGLNDVTTLTFLPGIEYQYPVTSNWTLSPFIDVGLARDFNNATNVLITGSGIKSYYNIPVNNALLSIGNRFLYARERNPENNIDSDYSLLETGLNYRVASDYSHNAGTLYSNLYYINYYYPNNLIFLEATTKPIRVGVEHEVGITFSNLPDFMFFKKPQMGAGIRLGNDIKVFRIVFGAPF